MPPNLISDPSRSGPQHGDAPRPDLAAILALCPDAVLVFDPAFTLTYVNPQAFALCRLSPEQSLGASLWSLRPELRGTTFEAELLAGMQGPEPRRLEYFDPQLDLWADVQIFPQAAGLVVFLKDITALKAAEQRRDDAAVELHQIYASTPDSVVVIDGDWNFSFANQQALDLLQSGSLVGQNLWQLFPGNLEEPYRSNYRRTMERRVPTEFEAFYPEPLRIWFRVLARPFHHNSIIIFFSNITICKAAEERRDDLTSRLDLVLDLTSDAVILLNRDYQFTFLNRNARALLSPVGEALGRNLWEIFPDAVYPGSPFLEHYDRAMNGIPGRFEAFYAAPLNLWFHVEVQPAEDGIVIFFRDITADRLAAESLTASEERYRILTDLSPQFIWMGSADGRVTYANQRFIEYIGRHLTPDNSGRWLNAFDPADRNRVVAVWSSCVQSGRDYDIEARLVRDRDSSSRWYRLRASAVRDEAGTVLHWLGVAIDIHESRTFAETLHQKQVETERQRAELESIYENTPIGLALFDPVTFRYLRINDELARMIGLPKEKIIGRSVLEIASGVASIGELFRQVSTGKPVRDYILEGNLSVDPQNVRTWNVNYFPVYDNSGQMTGISTASHEITQQRKTEAALMQSEKLAAVGRLASSISHEINNPLEAITNLLYLVASDEGLPQDLKVYVHMAQSELARVSQIATQTLRFHRQAVARTLVTAAQLTDAVLNLYQGRLTNSTIRVQATYASSTPILCFENDIRQVLNNLIANAIDAMRSGGRLLVRAHNTTDKATGRAGVRLTIADTGHGMSAATVSRLFEPFFTTKDLNGTGLGLWISQGIVQRHHGRLQVRSTQHPVHHGTIFSLFLPFS